VVGQRFHNSPIYQAGEEINAFVGGWGDRSRRMMRHAIPRRQMHSMAGEPD
jgi:hypothetical protein